MLGHMVESREEISRHTNAVLRVSEMYLTIFMHLRVEKREHNTLREAYGPCMSA